MSFSPLFHALRLHLPVTPSPQRSSVSEAILFFFAALMVLDALPDAVRLGRRILRPRRRRGGGAPGAGRGGGDAEVLARRVPEDDAEEPATLWGRVSKAKLEILALLVDAATVTVVSSKLAQTSLVI